jgi:hypothetical protein
MLQYISLIQSVDPLPENLFESVSADFVQTISDSRKKFIYRPELLSLEAVFEMPKQEQVRGSSIGQVRWIWQMWWMWWR